MFNRVTKKPERIPTNQNSNAKKEKKFKSIHQTIIDNFAGLNENLPEIRLPYLSPWDSIIPVYAWPPAVANIRRLIVHLLNFYTELLPLTTWSTSETVSRKWRKPAKLIVCQRMTKTPWRGIVAKRRRSTPPAARRWGPSPTKAAGYNPGERPR